MDPARQSDGLPDVRRAQFVAMMRAFHSGTSSLAASFRESAAYRIPKVLATIRRRIHNRAHARQTSADVGLEPHGNQKENLSASGKGCLSLFWVADAQP